jgi:quinol monooxygenase YgiN
MIIVSGHAKVKPGALNKAVGPMRAAIRATRREDGRRYCSYDDDVTAPDTIIVVKCWKDENLAEA